MCGDDGSLFRLFRAGPTRCECYRRISGEEGFAWYWGSVGSILKGDRERAGPDGPVC